MKKIGFNVRFNYFYILLILTYSSMIYIDLMLLASFALTVLWLIRLEMSKRDFSYLLYYTILDHWVCGKNEDEIVDHLVKNYRLKQIQAVVLTELARANKRDSFIIYHKALRTRKK